MSQDTSSPVTRVRSLSDLLGVVPHLLGFHPDESMVLIVIEHGHVLMTARTDLVDVGPEPHLELMIDRMLLRWPAAAVWLVCYSSDERSAWTMLDRGGRHLGDALAGDLICVSGEHYRVRNRFGPRFAYDPAATATAAEATLYGLQARPSRASLARVLRASPEESALIEDAWCEAVERFTALPKDQRGDVLLSVLQRGLTEPARVELSELAWIGALVTDPDARDRVVLSLRNEAAESWVSLWTRVVRACPHGEQQQPLAVLALAAWADGEGALQSVCLEELDAQGARPGLYGLLNELNSAMVPPTEWPWIRAELQSMLTDA